MCQETLLVLIQTRQVSHWVAVMGAGRIIGKGRLRGSSPPGDDYAKELIDAIAGCREPA